MNRKHLLLGIALVITLLAASTAFAGASHPQVGSDGGSGAIDATIAPRARLWYDNRLWQTDDGVILVCEENFIVDMYNDSKKCMAKGDKTDGSRWSVLQTKLANGFVLKSYEYRFTGSGGYKILIAYYGPPTVAQPAPEKAAAPIPAKLDIQVDSLVITAKKVVIEHPKHKRK